MYAYIHIYRHLSIYISYLEQERVAGLLIDRTLDLDRVGHGKVVADNLYRWGGVGVRRARGRIP